MVMHIPGYGLHVVSQDGSYLTAAVLNTPHSEWQEKYFIYLLHIACSHTLQYTISHHSHHVQRGLLRGVNNMDLLMVHLLTSGSQQKRAVRVGSWSLNDWYLMFRSFPFFSFPLY